MSKLDFPQYTTEYISGVMSLRSPQEESLRTLEKIIDSIDFNKSMDLEKSLDEVHDLYPICTDFEREFMSITFALATGVGKTRLMGAFITYLYTQYDIKNFFVVAPGTTVYEKLKKDLGDSSNPKYVFNGVGCFESPPQIITDDDYRDKNLSLFDSDIRIYVYNIDKFNKDDANMKHINEYLGESFYKSLSSLDDLIIIMDESHHYRAEKGALALNELHPLMGLELTATPLVCAGTKQVPFKNVVFEYPLSKAIEDGYTRTPYAVTRSDIDFFNFGDEQLDKMMISDGIICHERAKQKLFAYAENHNKKYVKPFMLIVCKNTNHAAWVEKYVKSNEFCNGKYVNKTIVVHSKQKGTESDANLKLLLDVENVDNPVEIVIHVNMLKEGWDVNNLYTIVPLRTAASKILREQMVGRGLRLPYGERTKDREIDAVMLTAHDKFKEILDEAQKGNSIFKAGNVIKVEELQKEEIAYTQLSIDFDKEETIQNALKIIGLGVNQESCNLVESTNNLVLEEVGKYACEPSKKKEEIKKIILEQISDKVGNDEDLARVFKENKNPLMLWAESRVEEVHQAFIEKFIPIPHIRVTDEGVEDYRFNDFDIDESDFSYAPISNELLVQNLEDMSDRKHITGNHIDFEVHEPKKEILQLLRLKPEIDYEKCSDLLFKLITQVCDYFESIYGLNGMRNIVMLNRRDIANKIYNQMMKHFYCMNGFIKEEVVSVSKTNLRQQCSFTVRKNLYENYTERITSILFEGIKYGVFSTAQFHSLPELRLARALERDAGEKKVLNWLRPAPQEFNITYNRGHHYEPDFVVETEEQIFLVEVKGEDKIGTDAVDAKKQRAIQYCKTVSNWARANGHKEWKHVFIPSQQIHEQSSFSQLARQFTITE